MTEPGRDAEPGGSHVRAQGEPPTAQPHEGGRPPRGLLRAVALVGLGVVVGIVGTVAHRWLSPWGLVLAVAAVLSAAVFARAVRGGIGLGAYAGGLIALIQLANSLLPGQDVLIVADALGYSWLVLPVVAIAVAAFLPHRWFDPATPSGSGPRA